MRATANATYCVGAPARRPHVLVQQALAPGEDRAVAVFLPRGEYRGAGPRIEAPCDVTASPAGYRAELAITMSARGLEVRPAVAQTGLVVLRLSNQTEHEQLVRLETVALRDDAVTAVAALAHPRFRELFSGELLPYGQHVSVSRAAFLFLDAPGRFGLLDRKGDAGALAIAGKLDELVALEAARREGSVSVESAAETPASPRVPVGRARAAGGGARHRQRRARRGRSRRRPPRRGWLEACIALTRGGKVDWFGETVTRGLSLLDEVESGGVALSFRVADDRDALAVLRRGRVRARGGRGLGRSGSAHRRVAARPHVHARPDPRRSGHAEPM